MLFGRQPKRIELQREIVEVVGRSNDEHTHGRRLRFEFGRPRSDDSCVAVSEQNCG